MSSSGNDQYVGIVGLGLIGGSIARRLTARGYKIIGFDTSAETISLAKSDHSVYEAALWYDPIHDRTPDAAVDPNRLGTCLPADRSQDNPAAWELLRLCEAVFICTPPAYTAECVKILRGKTDAILTDVAGVKQPVLTKINDRRFVGGHPMAGSEKTGYSHSSDSMLENAVYVICVPENTVLTVPELNRFKKIVQQTGATVLEMDAESHDKAVAAISHLPHVVAAALSQLASLQADSSLSRLAAGGFRDITRIASSNPDLWSSLTLESRQQLLPLLDEYVKLLDNFRNHLHKQNKSELTKFFFQAALYRSALPVDGRGALSAQSVLTVYVKDQPGELGKITTLLGERQINISNIRISELRAYEGGCLQLLLPDSEQAGRAAWLLREAGYECD